MVDSGLYESNEEAAARQEVLRRLDQVNYLFDFGFFKSAYGSFQQIIIPLFMMYHYLLFISIFVYLSFLCGLNAISVLLFLQIS